MVLGTLTPPIRLAVIIISDFQRFLLSIRSRASPGSITNEEGRVKISLGPLNLDVAKAEMPSKPASMPQIRAAIEPG